MAGSLTDPIAADEMAGTEVPAELSPNTNNKRSISNAFAELMAPKAKQAKPSPGNQGSQRKTQTSKIFSRRDGLGAYIESPDTFPPSRVVYYNEEVVCINDLYPKATVHLLILPRDPKFQMVHPIVALENPGLRATLKKEVARAKELVASELKRKYGRDSATSKAYNDAVDASLDADDPPSPSTFPSGRDWSQDVKDGIHAHPSMNHLHVHVLSRDMHSECLKHRKHYNSFNTDFLVSVDAFPLNEDDERKKMQDEKYLRNDLICWRCGRNFKEKFAKLKEHLEDEWMAWKQE
ncbi:HIT-like protein [Pseudovirgaria hyperparasitica]|uniref:Aprataxin-like protein n=1 Tax=Pseudovirgaria hyperparasitica TaxID=470096 RepID=A0A6A6WKI8_9PEZI|nr:HIT-like protein [Pseudovirgaria hyperparasitica]KAF2762710.1 HIT-like protein [Pseudovirgaria hyperparasitica]